MKAIYNNFALGLMALAVFCVSFALTLANPDEITTLAIVAGVSVGLSLWFLKAGEKK
jgi:FtsH-binding integral membrane protein